MPDPGKVGLPILMKFIAEINFNEIFRNPKSLYFLTFNLISKFQSGYHSGPPDHGKSRFKGLVLKLHKNKQRKPNVWVIAWRTFIEKGLLNGQRSF